MSFLDRYVRVPTVAADLQVGDMVLIEGPREPWRVDRLDVAAWGRNPAVISTAPSSDYTGPHLECATLHERVTVLVPADSLPTPRPHGARITAHNPVRRGCYTDPGGYDVACRCGWTHPDVAGDRPTAARLAWLPHKADVITELITQPAPEAFLVKVPQTIRHGGYAYRLIRLRRSDLGGGGR